MKRVKHCGIVSPNSRFIIRPRVAFTMHWGRGSIFRAAAGRHWRAAAQCWKSSAAKQFPAAATLISGFSWRRFSIGTSGSQICSGSVRSPYWILKWIGLIRSTCAVSSGFRSFGAWLPCINHRQFNSAVWLSPAREWPARAWLVPSSLSF